MSWTDEPSPVSQKRAGFFIWRRLRKFFEPKQGKQEGNMKKFDGFLFSKLFRIGTRSQGPEYFLQQWENRRKPTGDKPILKKSEAWKDDPGLQKYLGQIVTVTGTVVDDKIAYEDIGTKGETHNFLELPKTESCRLIDFEKVEIRPGFVSKTWILIVSGTKPYVNMEVELQARLYIRRPEYWGIEVIGCLHGIALPTTAAYSVSMQLNGVTGTKGIEVIGATRSFKKKVPPK
jgi:hypothetical protein